MKKIYTLTLIYTLPIFASAATNGVVTPPLKFTDLNQVVVAVVGVVQVLLIMATVLYLLYAGLMFVVAKGEPEKISKAKNALLWGMVGAGLVISAQVLVRAIESSVNSIFKS